ncbi:hypothetical protein Cgig2_030736 [Carnegiea gigantea]|uniref:Uncharacterized protein n=1 Tax=Carnegiea gigantea TaxID=171969 RepID=A0A9Q1KS74_9CARY|nr:hypothetical protein Cgig2_030736 [Carnegiea gigantea]
MVMSWVKPPQMNIICQNIRGMNCPNMQEDIRPSYIKRMLDLFALLETKIKKENEAAISNRIFGRWKAISNCKPNKKATHKEFYMTFVYGFNKDHKRNQSWEDFDKIADNMLELTIRVSINLHWYGCYDYVHAEYLTIGLSYHNPISFLFPKYPKVKKPMFSSVIKTTVNQNRTSSYMAILLNVLRSLKAPLRKWNEDRLHKYVRKLPGGLQVIYVPYEIAKWIELILGINRVDGFENVAKLMTAFYQELMGKQNYERKNIDMEVVSYGPILNIEQQNGLCNIVKKFFSIGTMAKACNATNLVLLPKIQAPQSTLEFRQISCCFVLYKCSAKLFFGRLKEVLSNILTPTKGHLW